jgi:hypothetical protein
MYIETEHMKGSRRFQKIEKEPATFSFVPPDQYCFQSERILSGIHPGTLHFWSTEILHAPSHCPCFHAIPDNTIIETINLYDPERGGMAIKYLVAKLVGAGKKY